MHFLFFLISFLLLSIASFGQDSENIPWSKVDIDTQKLSLVDTLIGTDTFYVKKDVVVLKKDSVVKKQYLRIGLNKLQVVVLDTTYLVKDTIVVEEDTVYSLNEKLLRKVYYYSKKENIFAQLIDNIFSYNPSPDKPGSSGLVKSYKPFRIYEDKTIRSVKVKVLGAMGYNIKDTLQKPRSLLEKSANLIHINSHDWIIKNQLLFKTGDKVDPFILAETERLLRKNNYLYEANILVKDSPSIDSVDITVLVQDVFSISAGMSGDINSKSADITVKDVNFLGLGQTLVYSTQFGGLYSDGANHFATYHVNNIHRSFVSSNIYYNFYNGRKSYGTRINRELVTPSLKWVGGVNFLHFTYPYDDGLNILPNHFDDTITFNNQDVWFGVPTGLFISDKKEKLGKRLIFGARYQRFDYRRRPEIKDKEKYLYYDSDWYLGNVSLYSRRSYTDKYIFRFGRTEDIPEGSLLSLTGGVHNTTRASRFYTGTSYSLSTYKNRVGYTFFNIGIGGFFNKGKIEDGAFQVKSLYFTPLLNIRRWNFRQFFGVRYAKGHNMLLDQRIEIDKDKGVRGFSSDLIQGNQKVVLNFETDIFLPVNVVGFHFAFVFFTDFAWVSFNKTLLHKDNFFPAYGFGLKIKNEHLIFNAIQILFGFYPNAGRVGESNYLFFQRSNSFYTFNDFNYTRPDIITFY